MSWQLVPAHNFHIPKENRKNGMKENLDTEIKKLFEFGYPYIGTECYTSQCNVPGSYGGKDMHKNLDRARARKNGKVRKFFHMLLW
jgi:hypothetical protein